MAKVSKSPWLLHYDASSCNGCDIEVLDCLTPKYDIERFGVINTGDPFQADIFLITGGVNSQTESVVNTARCRSPKWWWRWGSAPAPAVCLKNVIISKAGSTP